MHVYALVCLAIALCVAEANPNFPNQEQKVAVGRAMDLASQAINPLLQRYATLGVFDHPRRQKRAQRRPQMESVLTKRLMSMSLAI